MTATGLANEFAAEIPGSTTSGDVFEYYITATDDVPLPNTAREPAAGYHTFTILDGPQAIHRFPLDSPGTGALAADDPGWDRQGGWAFGKPTGGGTHNGDPTTGYTGQYVFGYNLSGDYPDSMATTHWLTTGALDCTGAWFVSLRFWRWLGVESGDFDEVCVEASNDGTTWTRVWDNTGSEAIQDTAWAYQEYDISAVASNQSTVYVRWGMGPTDSSVSYPGWNLDDIEVWGHLLASAPLMPPAPLDLSPITDGSIQANWDPNGNPTGTLYQAQCYAGSGFGGTLVEDTGYDADRLAYDFAGLDPNAQYSFRVRAQKADASDESVWVSLGTAYTLAQTPGSLTLVLTAMDGGALNPDGPAPTSLGIDTLDTRSNPSTTEYAIQLGSDPDQGWLRLDDSTANPDDLAHGAIDPEWHTLADWQGKRICDLQPDTEYTLRAMARNHDDVEGDIVVVAAAVRTSKAGDVDRSDLATGLDYAYIKAVILKAPAILYWNCDVTGDRVVDAADLAAAWAAAMAPE